MTVDASRSCLGLGTCVGSATRQIVDARVLLTATAPPALPGTACRGMFKPPILRDLAVRSPYFHAGAAQDIEHLINFYNLRFGFGLTAEEQTDLANFIDTSL